MSEIKKPGEELREEQTEQVTGGDQEVAVEFFQPPVVVACQVKELQVSMEAMS